MEYATFDNRKTVNRMTLRYTIVGGVLYMRSFLVILLRCLNDKEIRTIIEQTHIRVCGGHVNGHMLTKKINRMGYFWPTVEECKICREMCPIPNLCRQDSRAIVIPSPSNHTLAFLNVGIRRGGSSTRHNRQYESKGFHCHCHKIFH